MKIAESFQPIDRAALDDIVMFGLCHHYIVVGNKSLNSN